MSLKSTISELNNKILSLTPESANKHSAYASVLNPAFADDIPSASSSDPANVSTPSPRQEQSSIPKTFVSLDSKNIIWF